MSLAEFLVRQRRFQIDFGCSGRILKIKQLVSPEVGHDDVDRHCHRNVSEVYWKLNLTDLLHLAPLPLAPNESVELARPQAFLKTLETVQRVVNR